MEGGKVIGVELAGKINRQDFGLVWNVALETGGVLIGDEVKIEAFLEIKQA
jgi:polyisoprenoid-binding protein YceI